MLFQTHNNITVKAVEGAAEYFAEANDKGKGDVVMYPTNYISGSVIQCCYSMEAAHKAAMRWQRKENRAVLKSHGQI